MAGWFLYSIGAHMQKGLVKGVSQDLGRQIRNRRHGFYNVQIDFRAPDPDQTARNYRTSDLNLMAQITSCERVRGHQSEPNTGRSTANAGSNRERWLGSNGGGSSPPSDRAQRRRVGPQRRRHGLRDAPVQPAPSSSIKQTLRKKGMKANPMNANSPVIET
jgi:hypothetical protein